MDYVTIEGVELVAVGMEWQAASGLETFTFENLSDALTAANEDPHVLDPRIKLGHDSGINLFMELGDAEPAFGRVVNLRLENEGAMLVGDFIEVPEWLAQVMPSAFPNRSIEARRMVTTEGGKQYSMVLTAVALLGAIEPAVKTLDDLERFLVDGPSVAAASNPNPEEGPMADVAASVDVGTIRERFNFDWAMDPDNPLDQDTYYWWAISVRVDPGEVIAEDETGQLWSVTWATDGKDEVTFGTEATKVREEFVPVAASATTVVAKLRDRKDQKVLARNLDRPDKPDKTAASAQPEHEEDEMTDVDLAKLRGRLGLAEDASLEDINEALSAPVEPTDTEPVIPTDEVPEVPETAVTAPEPVTASAKLPDGMVAVPADQWAAVQSGAKAGTAVAAKAEEAKRDETIASAMRVGKVPPAQRDGLVNLHASNPDAFYTLLTAEVKDGGLQPGLVPVTEVGVSGGDEVTAAAGAGLPGSWFPELTRNGAGSGAQED